MNEESITQLTWNGITFLHSFEMQQLSGTTALLSGVVVNDLPSLRLEMQRSTVPTTERKAKVREWAKVTESLVKQMAVNNGVTCVFMSDRINKEKEIGAGESYSDGVGTSVFMKYLMDHRPAHVMQFPISRNYNYDSAYNYSMIQPLVWYPFNLVPKDRRIVIPSEADFVGEGVAAWEHVLDISEDLTGDSREEFDNCGVSYL